MQISHAYLRGTIEWNVELCKRSDARESVKPKAERRETSLNLQDPQITNSHDNTRKNTRSNDFTTRASRDRASSGIPGKKIAVARSISYFHSRPSGDQSRPWKSHECRKPWASGSDRERKFHVYANAKFGASARHRGHSRSIRLGYKGRQFACWISVL